MNEQLYRITRLIVLFLSVYLSLYYAKCNIVYSTIYVCIIFLILDLYFPRIDYE